MFWGEGWGRDLGSGTSRDRHVHALPAAAAFRRAARHLGYLLHYNVIMRRTSDAQAPTSPYYIDQHQHQAPTKLRNFFFELKSSGIWLHHMGEISSTHLPQTSKHMNGIRGSTDEHRNECQIITITFFWTDNHHHVWQALQSVTITRDY